MVGLSSMIWAAFLGLLWDWKWWRSQSWMGGRRVDSAFELGCESKNVSITRSQARSQLWEAPQKRWGLGFPASFLAVFFMCSQLQARVFLLPLITSFQLCTPGMSDTLWGPSNFSSSFHYWPQTVVMVWLLTSLHAPGQTTCLWPHPMSHITISPHPHRPTSSLSLYRKECEMP